MSRPLTLSALELDALRETGNMGAARAAAALSGLLGRPVGIDIPKASAVRLETLPSVVGGPEAVAAAVYFRLSGEAPGRILLLLDESSLAPLLSALLSRPVSPSFPLSAECASALKELGNILCGNYLNAMAEFTGLTMLPSVPALAVDMAGAVLQSVASDAAQDGDQALLLETHLFDSGRPVPLYLFHLPEPGALEVLLAALARNTGVDPRGGRG
jgi:chemotaxis protein CheC